MKVTLAIIWFAVNLVILLSITSAVENTETVNLDAVPTNSHPLIISRNSPSITKEVSYIKNK